MLSEDMLSCHWHVLIRFVSYDWQLMQKTTGSISPVFFLRNYKKIFHRMNLVVEKFVHIYEKNVDTEMLINKK